MFKNTLLALLSIFSLQLFCITATAFADAASDLEQADGYYESGEYQQALTAYQNIVTVYPGTDYALKAQTGIAKVNLAVGNNTAADAATEKLKNDFSNHSGLPKAINEVARKCRSTKIKRYSKAIELYQYSLGRWPTGEYALESQKLIAKASIEAGDINAVDGAVAKLLSDYSSNPGLAKAVYDVAECSYAFGKYQKAIQFYQQALGENLDTKYAMRSLKMLARANIKLGNNTAADAAISKLCSDYTSHEDLPDYLCDAADCYRESKKYEKANISYQYVLDNWPNNKEALRAQKNIIKSHIMLGNETAADAAYSALLTNFSEDEGIFQAVCSLADSYRESKRYEKAIQVYQYSLDHWPDNKLAIFSQRGLVIANIYLGDDTKAEAAKDKLIVDFNDHPGLSAVLFDVGEEYYNKALKNGYQDPNTGVGNYFSKALTVWGEITQGISVSAERIATTHFYSAVCCYKAGDYAKAAEHYEKVVQKCPDYEFAWNAQFMVGGCYKKLTKAGDISNADGQGKIRTAYEQLLIKYPNCKVASIASSWLSKYANSQ